jgi:hypothetical protein
MTRRNLIAAAVAFVALSAAGCLPGKLNEVKTFDMESGNVQAFDSPAQKAAQTVKVEVTSDKPVDVYALLNTTAGEAVNLLPDQAKAKAAASKTKVTGDSFTVSVPAGQGLVVWVGVSDFGTRAKGTVKLTN